MTALYHKVFRESDWTSSIQFEKLVNLVIEKFLTGAGGFEDKIRYLIEKIRVNDRYEVLGGFTQAEFIALILVGIGLVWGGWLLVARWKRS